MLREIADRRAIRNFTDQPIEEEKLQEIFEAIRLSPSWANRQCWTFVVVRDPEKRRAIARAASPAEYYGDLNSPDYRGNPAQKAIAAAPVVLVGCADPKKSGAVRGMDYYLTDMGIAVENIMLTATGLGLGTVFVGVFSEPMVKELLHIPEEVRVVALVPVGYPARIPEPRPRRDLSDIIYEEEWP
ncbi:MAG: nitroreductase [Chloroflexota bacterium]|nr:MAG: nitroreductase [Chloroflexota bacterium]